MRYIIIKDLGLDTQKIITQFLTLKEAINFIDITCDMISSDKKSGYWFIQSQLEPIRIEIMDSFEQVEALAVC